MMGLMDKRALYRKPLERYLNNLLPLVFLVVIPGHVVHPPETPIHLSVPANRVTPSEDSKQD